MPFLSVAGGKMHYAVTGVRSAPVLVLSNSLGTTFSMWDAQIAAFEKRFRVLRYDTRGHGQSTATPGPYTFDRLGGDVVALLNELKIDRAYFCGLSMGGMTGMWLGLHAADRLGKLISSSASAKFGTTESWNLRIETVRERGMTAVAMQVVERWYTEKFRHSAPEVARATVQMLEATSAEGYAACCAALRDTDLRGSVQTIHTPTLIIGGAKDPVSPPADGQYLARQIPGAEYCELDAAHLCNIEAADAYTNAVLKFLNSEGA
jgi:3-oxoadipate enol-lactonase